MELVARAAFIYVFLFVIMRISGNRQFSGLTNFDVVLLLIISEATQQGLLGNDDFSMTAAFILVGTLVGIDIALSLVKQRSKKADIVMEGVPVLLFDSGEFLRDNMNKERVDEDDIRVAARSRLGLETLDGVKYAVLERGGSISIIPHQNPFAPGNTQG
jgi:uncharacterized membrane protein YcaP (DUF421 family)